MRTHDFLGRKIGIIILITCCLLYIYEQTGSVIHCWPIWLSPFLHTHFSSDISLCDSGYHYKSPSLVGFMYPVIALHVWLSSGSSRCTCLDLDHTGVAYLATEYHKINDIVMIVLAFVPHLEFDSFFMKLFRVEPPSSLFSVCLLVTKCPVLGYT